MTALVVKRLNLVLRRAIVGPPLPGSVQITSVSQSESAKAVYDQLCNSYRAIDDFRTKLLGLLPLATGTGLILLLEKLSAPTEQQRLLLLPMGIFGFLVTLGLFCYEIYGIRKCHALIEGGTEMEESLGTVGQFRKRPREVAGLINEPFAAALIYPAVLAAWVYVALMYRSPEAGQWIALSTFILFSAATLAYNRVLGRSARHVAIVRASPVSQRKVATSVTVTGPGGDWQVSELRAART